MQRRFLARGDWPLIAAGVAAGVVTSVLLLWLFLTSIGGGTSFDAELRVDSATAVAEELEGRERPARAPIVGAREHGIAARLDALPVRTTPLRGPLRVTARNVVWTEPGGARFARTEAITANLATARLGRGDVVLSDVVVTRPVVDLRESGGAWNHQAVFAELLEGGDPSAPKRLLQIRGIRLVDGRVTITRPEQRVLFTDVNASASLVVLSQPGVAAPYMRLSRATMDIQGIRDPQSRFPLDVGAGTLTFPDGTVRFDLERAVIDGTRFADLEGVWNPRDPGYGVTATGRALAVRFEDVRFLLPPEFPETGTATFDWAVRPVAPDATEVTLTSLDGRSGDSRVSGSLSFLIAPERFQLLAADLEADPVMLGLVEGFTGPLPYGGSVAGSITGTGGDIRFDLIANLTAPGLGSSFRLDIAGRALISADAFRLQQADVDFRRVPLAALRAVAPGLPLDGLVTGRVSLTGMPGDAPLQLDTRLELGTGVALLAGTLDLTGATPRYDFDGRLIGVDLAGILEPDVPPVSVTARFTLAGAGFDPATMDAQLGLAGGFVGWQSGPRDTLFAAARIAGGSIRMDSLHARLSTLELSGGGTWQFVEPRSGALRYALDITSLEPWGPWIPVIGDSISGGAVAATGTLSGPLGALSLAGVLSAQDLHIGQYQAARLDGEYDVTLGGALPRAIVVADATDLRVGTGGDYDEATLNLQLTPPDFTYSVNALREDGGIVEVAGTGVLPEEGERVVVVEQARFDLADDRWLLQRPAYFRWTGGGPVEVEGLELLAGNSAGIVALDGIVFPLAQVDADVALAEFPVGDVQRLLGMDVVLEGLLWVEGEVRGGANTTLVDVEFRVQEGVLAGVPLTSAGGRLSYRDNMTSVAAALVVDTAGRMDVDVALPSYLRIGAQPVFELIDGAPLRGELTAVDFALAPLAELVPQLTRVTGTVDAAVTLSGTADAPDVAGTAVLAGGSATVPELNQTFTDIGGTVSLRGRELLVEDLRVRSDGYATVGGRVVLERLDEPVLDLTVDLDGFRPMGVEDHDDAAVRGQLAITGQPDALLVRGAVRIDDGDVVIPEMGGGLDPDLVDITRPFDTRASQTAADQGPGLFESLRVEDLLVEFGDGVWVNVVDARVQLTGTLTVNKVGDATPIVGTLEGSRGQYTLVAGPLVRRFEIIGAQVRFQGNPTPDPMVDITARRVVLDPDGRQLNVDVRITGRIDNLTLSLASGEGATLSESELLNILVFGQAGVGLASEGEALPGQDLLGQTYLGAVSEVLALELERSLGGLGLDVFQVRFGTGFSGLSAPTFIFGRQLRRDVFLTVETGVNALLGEGATDELNAFAVRLDWTFDRRSRLRLAWEPVYRARGLRSYGLTLPAFTDPQQQFLVEVRRRWTW